MHARARAPTHTHMLMHTRAPQSCEYVHIHECTHMHACTTPCRYSSRRAMCSGSKAEGSLRRYMPMPMHMHTHAHGHGPVHAHAHAHTHRAHSQLLQSTDEDFAPMRHPMTPVWNFGFFFAQGGRSSSFFECGVRMWERKQLLARHAGDSRTDIGINQQRFVYGTCGAYILIGSYCPPVLLETC